MNFDPAALSPLSAVLAALVVGSTSLAAAIYTRRSQDRLQRVAAEVQKRESVYAEFLMGASNLLLVAHTTDELVLSGEEQHLIGLINRMRLFAPPEVIATAENVLRALVRISLAPGMELRDLATKALAESLEPDPLLKFSLVCRRDLDSLHRAVHLSAGAFRCKPRRVAIFQNDAQEAERQI